MNRPRVLLVDDDRSILEALGGVIEAEGFEVVRAANGHEALQKFRQQSMDIVLLDLNMPVKDGWDTFEGLTTVNPLLPIVIITARADANSEAIAKGITTLMQKPLDIPLLLEKMNESARRASGPAPPAHRRRGSANAPELMNREDGPPMANLLPAQ